MVDYRRSTVATNEPAVFFFILYDNAWEELSNRKANYVTAAAACIAIIRKLQGRVVVPRLHGGFE